MCVHQSKFVSAQHDKAKKYRYPAKSISGVKQLKDFIYAKALPLVGEMTLVNKPLYVRLLMLTYIHSIHTYIPYIHTIHTYMHSIHIPYIHTYLHSCIKICIHTYILCIKLCIHTNINTYIHSIRTYIHIPLAQLCVLVIQYVLHHCKYLNSNARAECMYGIYIHFNFSKYLTYDMM